MFSMKVVGHFYGGLLRQVNEAVRIEMSEADRVINSKAAFHQSLLLREVAVTGQKEEYGEGLNSRQEGQSRRRGGAGNLKALERGNSVLRPKGFCEANKVKLFAFLSHDPKCCYLPLIDTLIPYESIGLYYNYCQI